MNTRDTIIQEAMKVNGNTNTSQSHIPMEAVHILKFKVVNMRPALAEQLLARLHPNQRPSKMKKIEQYAADMEAGRWDLTHQAIGVDEDGYMMDGQNRLHAVVKSKATVRMVICYGVPSKGIVNTDTGAGRNINDAAKVSGVNFSNKSYASVARRMRDGLNVNRRRGMTVQETLDFISSYEEGIGFAFEVMKVNLKGVTQAPVRAVVARAFYTKDTGYLMNREARHNRMRQFGEEIISGLPDNSKTDAAVITLRNWLLEVFEGGKAKVRRSPAYIYAVTEYTLDAYLKRQRITQLIPIEEELFPLPEVQRYDKAK